MTSSSQGMATRLEGLSAPLRVLYQQTAEAAIPGDMLDLLAQLDQAPPRPARTPMPASGAG